ncbi:hypothetical protein ES703_15439 [subsurface metagenome]
MPSYSVPIHLLYQSVTMIWPSGLKQGTMRKTTLSRMRFVSASSLDSRSYVSSGAIWVPPISVAWRLIDWQMTALPSLICFFTSSLERPSGSASLLLIFRIFSRFFRFLAEEMMHRRNGWPSVEGPMSMTLILSLSSSSLLK